MDKIVALRIGLRNEKSRREQRILWIPVAAAVIEIKSMPGPV